MAQFYKAHVVDSDAYPLPESQRSAAGDANPDDAEVAQARSELQQIVDTIAALKPQIDSLAASAAESARQQGYNDGLAKAHEEVKGNLVEAITALTEAQRERQRLAGTHAGAIRELAVRVARKVIAGSFEADPALVNQVVEETLAEIEPSYSLEVRVHPQSVETVEAARERLERLVAGGGRISVVGDRSVDVGGCILITPVGDVDARVSTKLSVLEAALKADPRPS